MSANDVLDVLNIQREGQQPAKKKQKTSVEAAPRQTGMARELYNLLGPNTPPVNLSTGSATSMKDKINFKTTPWTRMPFKANKKQSPTYYHWVKGSKEFLEQEATEKPYFFDKFNVSIDIPDLVDEEKYNQIMEKVQAKIEKERALQNEIKAESSKSATEKDSQASDSTDASKASREEGSTKDEETVKPNPEEDDKQKDPEWTYEETKELFSLCKAFELKWHAVHDRFSSHDKTLEDIKEHFYRISAEILVQQENTNPTLVEQLNSYSKSKEVDRKKYLESLLKRTPAEIAEEESLVIEARRFELAAKKMLMERSNLLTLLDSPQTSQNVLQYQSSQGLANLYNNLMILDKHQKKRQLQQQLKAAYDPVPPPIPIAASSSFKRDRGFQTHLQQYLSGVLKQQQSGNIKQEPNAIQQLLAKRLTVKEEEAYGLYYHANEKLTPGVILRSTQRLPGLQQRQSVLKSVNTALQELDIPTAGGTSWKPVMPTRKTMAKYDELLRSVVALLDVKRGKDKLESEIRLIKSQRGLQ